MHEHVVFFSRVTLHMEEHTLAGEVPLAVRVVRPAVCRGAAFIAHRASTPLDD